MRDLFTSVVMTLACLAIGNSAFAQGERPNLFTLPRLQAVAAPETEVTTALIAGKEPGVITLQIRIDLPKGVNTYSMNPDLPKPTRVKVSLPDGWTELDKQFSTDPAPKKEFDEAFGKELEKFYDSVIYSRRYALPRNTDPRQARLAGEISFLICNNSLCTPKNLEFQASFSEKSLKRDQTAGAAAVPESSPATLVVADIPAPPGAKSLSAPLAFGYQMTPQRKGRNGDIPDPVKLQFELTPQKAAPGETVTLAITMSLDDKYTTYGLKPADDTQPELPTVITIKPSHLEEADEFVAVPKPEIHVSGEGTEVMRSNAHHHQVTWLKKFKVTDAAPYGLTGTVRYQICETGQSCRPPLSVAFSLGAGQRTEDITTARPIEKSFADADTAKISATTTLGDPLGLNINSTGSDLSFAGAFLTAFLAGLIMNVLPCVLPVLAIKILSLVQQAGESRGRIIALNLSYTAGVMAVFLGFAIISWGLGSSFSSVFQNETFMIAMACVVFLMGLSLFGVFELPVPGIIPSAGHHQEGYMGAFNTGILATLLGTPCIGPFIAPVFTWTLSQPPSIVFSIFGMMGLGMASPFLLTGIVPSLVNWLPRPGDWMVKFKQFTGFVLMGTVIWLLLSIEMVWRVPVLVLLLSLAMLVWVNENLAFNHDPAWKKWRAHLIALTTAAPIFAVGIWMLQEFKPIGQTEVQISKMPWQEFSEEQLVKLRTEGRPMLIDFTANWCVICKINEKIALDRDETVKFIESNGFVPLLADFTRENPEILKWLREFGQESVPLTIIVPPGQGSEIIALRGQYTQRTLLKKLKEAIDGSKSLSNSSASQNDSSRQMVSAETRTSSESAAQ